ncbi:MAG: ethanolamine ammonia-lyase subunit EutC [Planctomycetales bacterium]|nr:ethanolamine ammonia-lyase subunit EutC [Planctomycetales bacterium]
MQKLHVDGLIEQVRARTPARILVTRAGTSYAVGTQLELRGDHAAALDAVRAELDIAKDFGLEFVTKRSLFQVPTLATSKQEYLLRPDLGRKLCDAARELIAASCPTGCDVQLVIGDGLSAQAVRTQVPLLLPALEEAIRQQGWSLGQSFSVRHCRVGLLNELGELLSPQVVVLLIGERPGLATSESLSAYLAFRPRPGHTDAQRNLISNIHARGVPPLVAAERIAIAIRRLMQAQASGVGIDTTTSEPLPLPPPSG